VKELFKTSNEFSMYIENVATTKRISYVDALLDYCEKHMIDPIEVSGQVNRSLKSKLEHEFQEMRYLPQTAQLKL
jgi:hypothetical protein